jgi:hypothetical protein
MFDAFLISWVLSMDSVLLIPLVSVGICKIYEEHLRQLNPHSPSITYDISQLFKFIDDLFDLSCLVHQPTTASYIPHNKEWLKEKIYGMLKKQAGSRH